MSGEVVHEAVVVGAGLAGLAAATRLASRGFAPVVLEAGPRAGGCVRTDRDGPWLLEGGPNSLRGACPAIASLAGNVGLSGERVEATPAAKARWLWVPDGTSTGRGRRVALPSGPLGLLTTEALTPAGRLRLFSEPWRRPWDRPVDATTLADFLGDRLGPEGLERLGAPFTTGVFAGEPEHIGVEALAPLEAATRAGGLVRGMAAMRQTSTGSGLWAFREGLGQLTDALAGRLDVRTGAAVDAVSVQGPVFRVSLADDGTLLARRLVLACPPRVAARLLGAVVGAEAAALRDLPAASVVSVGLGLREADFASPPEGFGMLVARQSPLPPVLGVVFASRVFAGRAPAGHVALSAICGGTRHAASAGLPDSALIEGVLAALRTAFGLREDAIPVVTRVSRWEAAIPQIPPGHRARVSALRQALPAGLALAGAGLGGVSLEQVALSGLAAADHVSR